MPKTLKARSPKLVQAAKRRRKAAQISRGILYRGPSLIDGTPIVVIAVWRRKAANTKTGPMVQTYILPDVGLLDIMQIVRTGLDVSVCGGCTHRYRYDANGIAIRGTRTCYVNLGQGVQSVLSCFGRGGYQDVSNDAALIEELGRGRMVRLGTWGDPAAVPAPTWAALLADSVGHTGYTHQWRSKRLAAPIRDIVMASCETEADVLKAKALGFAGTFRVLPVFELPAADELCPASAEAGKQATCFQCGRCNGQGGDVAIVAHGSMRGRYLPNHPLVQHGPSGTNLQEVLV